MRIRAAIVAGVQLFSHLLAQFIVVIGCKDNPLLAVDLLQGAFLTAHVIVFIPVDYCHCIAITSGVYPFYHQRLPYKAVLGIKYLLASHIILAMLLDHPAFLIVIVHRPEEIGAAQYVYLCSG
ncbi:hypothetical protein D3C72_823040 [compost metagenome]